MLPNVIIAGAPRCGTTSLFNYLTSHPQVCGSTVKETRYLVDKNSHFIDQEYNYHKLGLSGYESFLKHCTLDDTVIEATPMYLYNQTPLEVLPSLDPAPEIIFILRNPAYRAYSNYKFAYGYLHRINNTISFSLLIDILLKIEQNTDLNSKQLEIAQSIGPVAFNTLEEGKYEKYLKKWLTLYDPEKIHIYLYEDFRDDPQGLMQNISEMLQIDPEFYDSYDFTVHNEPYFNKFPKVHKQIKNIEKLLDKTDCKSDLYFQLKYWLKKRFGHFFIKNINNFLDERGKYETLLRLHDYYTPFNNELSRLVNLDLYKWKVEIGD